MQEIRNYGAGNQSKERYRNWFTNGSSIGNSSLRNNTRTDAGGQSSTTGGNTAKVGNRKGFANISFDIFSPMAKLSNVLLAFLSDNDYKVDFVSLDKNIVAKKKRKKEDIYVKSKLINPLARELGLPQMYVPFVPKDQAELEMAERLGKFKTRQEVALEKLAESGFRASKWKHERLKINRDAIDFGFRCVKLYNDRQTGQVKFRYVDPCNLVMLWNETSENEPVAIGEVISTTIQAIYHDLVEAGFTDEQIQMMAKEQGAWQPAGTCTEAWIWERKDKTSNRWLWMDFKVYVMQFEYLSTDYKHYADRKVKDKTYYQDIKNPEKVKKKGETGEYDDYKCNYWYEGNYIISGSGQDMVYGWKKKANQMQKGLNPLSSFVFDRLLGEAPTSRVIGLLDQLQQCMLKLRAAVWAAAPKGYRMDVGNGANIMIGGQEYSPFDLIHIHRQNGVKLVATKFNAATGKYVVDVFESEDNGLGPQGLEWIQQIAQLQNMILDTLGIPEIMAVSGKQSAERLPGVVERDMEAGNNANFVLAWSERRFKEKIGERITLQSRIDIEYDKRCKDTYEGLIGPDLIKALDEMEGLSLDQMGISTQALPTEKEKAVIMETAVEMSKIATRDGSVLLRPSSIERVRQYLKNDDIDEALWFMDAEETAAREREQKWAAEMAQQTIQGQQQSAVVAERAKMQSALAMAQIETAKMRERANIEMTKEREIQKMKNDNTYEVQLLKGKQALDEINLEATLEAMYGTEITGRV